MRMEQVKEIANAVLYEGYLLYPYRRSAIKNRQRWTFGVVYPCVYSQAGGGIEPWTMQTECLVQGSGDDVAVDVTVRFLHLLKRSEHQPQENTSTQDSAPGGSIQMPADWFRAEAWEEGVEREVHAPNLRLHELTSQEKLIDIDIAGEHFEEVTARGTTLVRELRSLSGRVRLAAEQVEAVVPPLFKLRVAIENTTPGAGEFEDRYQGVLLQSFISTHSILQVRQGAFLSLLDPPASLQAAAQSCQNLRTWPVMIGDEGDVNTVLSSPIILYDYPQIAPESPGSLFDGTEIDEILSLRIMTLTDEEKEELRQGDERAREILERTEALTPEQFMKLHGVIRNLRPVSEGEET